MSNKHGKHTCPFCAGPLVVNLAINDGKIEASLVKEKSWLASLVEDLIAYWRLTCGETKPRHDPYYDPKSYFKPIDFGLYTYDIQTSDSPEGDTWVSGTLQLHWKMGKLTGWTIVNEKSRGHR